MSRYPGRTDVRTTIESPASPFSKLALAHAIGVSGDIFVTVALADSIFFSADPGAARPKVLLYLFFTMAPFAIVAPVLGPFIDRSRGGRRLLFMASCAGRALLCLFMAANIKGLALYPLAFGSLVLSKGQGIAKSALVPAVVDDESELVRANSRLQLDLGARGNGGAVDRGRVPEDGRRRVGAARRRVRVRRRDHRRRSAFHGRSRSAQAETTEERRELHPSSIRRRGHGHGPAARRGRVHDLLRRRSS